MTKFTSVWEFDLLWSKCNVYTQKAISESRESPMFPFWCALALEFLGRATLSKIHPVLLADPREGDNILYVFGFSKAEGPPKSIAAKTVFDRCFKIVPGFTKKELDACLKLIDRRNEELHSGSAAFADYSTKHWLADFYNACKILLEFLGFSLEILFGKSEGSAAEEMITEVDTKLLKAVKLSISKFAKSFAELSDAEKESKLKMGSEKALENHRSGTKIEKCICCNADGLLAGKVVSVSQDKLIDGDIIYERIILPTSFTCYSCGFKLIDHQELVIADYGGQFTEQVVWDPSDFHGISTTEIDPADLYDYGND
ncbi:hypothetical protein [Chitinophaga sp. ARDCPP14]|uniref:hypothetical protein n=1 Tax=Chitinophaga sp. ARDCPP14 TaxID=3391139 RepID=UPI003F522BF4